MAEFEMYCKDNEIKFAWSVIEDSQGRLFEKLPFKNFVKVIFPEGVFEEKKFFSYRSYLKLQSVKIVFTKKTRHVLIINDECQLAFMSVFKVLLAERLNFP